MARILLVLPTLEYSGAGKQAALLAEMLPRDQYEVRVCALGGEGPVAQRLKATGARVAVLGRGHLFNLVAFWRWRRLLSDFQPDVIHTWGNSPLRLAAFAPGPGGSRLVATAPFPAPRERGNVPGRLDRWLLRRVETIVARGPAEAHRFHGIGLPVEKVAIIPPGVEIETEEFTSSPGHPVTRSPCHPVTLSPCHPATPTPSRWITCAGSLQPHKGFRDAIWAFDILRFLYDDLKLALIGSGPDRQRLERFAVGLRVREHVHFLGNREDVSAHLAQSEIVWVPSLAETGINVALEAMARGRPVVAARQTSLAEIVADGDTGLLYTPGDKLELARKTRLLLDDTGLARRLGDAGRGRAFLSFPSAAMVESHSNLYQNVPRPCGVT